MSIFRHAHDGNSALLKQEARAFFDFSIAQYEETRALFTRLAAKMCDAVAFKTFLLALPPDLARPVTAAQNGAARKAYETRMDEQRAARAGILDPIWPDGPPMKAYQTEMTIDFGEVGAASTSRLRARRCR